MTEADRALFDRCFEGSRGRLPDDRYPGIRPFLNRFKAFMDADHAWFRENGRCRKPMPHIVFDYTADTLLDSSVAVAGDRWLIGLTVGAVIACLDFFLRLLSQPRILRQIGTPDAERAGRHTYPVYDDAKRLVKEYEDRGIALADLCPLDPARRHVAFGLAILALYFLLKHEFRHLTAGHRKYLDAKYPASEPESALMVNQAMEFDADAYAVEQTLRFALSKAENPARVDQEWRGLFPTPADALLRTMAAVYGFCRFTLNTPAGNRGAWEFQQYAPDRIRMTAVVTHIEQCLRTWGKEELLSIVHLTAGRVMSDLERGIALLSGSEEDWSEIQILIGRDAYQHVAEVLRLWNNIRAEVEAYSFVPLEEALIE